MGGDLLWAELVWAIGLVRRKCVKASEHRAAGCPEVSAPLVRSSGAPVRDHGAASTGRWLRGCSLQPEAAAAGHLFLGSGTQVPARR